MLSEDVAEGNMPQTVNDKVYAVYDDMRQTHAEAVQTYGADVAMAALAYMVASAVHGLEHDPRLVPIGQNARAMALGVWTQSLHQFLAALNERCDETRAHGVN